MRCGGGLRLGGWVSAWVNWTSEEKIIGHVMWQAVRGMQLPHSQACLCPCLPRRRAKLEAEGWSVPASVSTVPIPGVNMPLNGDYRDF